MDEKGQMMVIELMFFAAIIFFALIFMYQLALPSRTPERYSADLEVLGNTALSTLNSEAPTRTDYYQGLPSSKLVQYLLTDDVGGFLSDINNLLPSSVTYNVYIETTSFKKQNYFNLISDYYPASYQYYRFVPETTSRWFWCNSQGESTPLLTINPVTVSHQLVVIHPFFWENVYPNPPYEFEKPDWNFNTFGTVCNVQLELWYI